MLGIHWYKAKTMDLLSPKYMAEGKIQHRIKNTLFEFKRLVSLLFSVLWYTLSSSNSTVYTPFQKSEKGSTLRENKGKKKSISMSTYANLLNIQLS